jgi:hypothetical protein
MQISHCSTTLLVFVDACENLVMVDDVVTPSNSPVSPIEKEKLEEAPLDVNVFQRSCKEEPFIRVMHTQINCLAWDCRWSPNPHALAIYLEFVPARGTPQKGLKSVNLKMKMFVFIIKLEFLVMAIIIRCKAQSTPFPWSIESNT